MKLPIAIIGAGLAGVACARHLSDHGRAVHVFEKSRGIGGRLAQRRVTGASFDLGAQYFTARHPQFAAQLARWIDDGVVQRWQARVGSWRSGSLAASEEQHTEQIRWVGVPAMNHLARALANDAGKIQLQLGVRIQALTATAAPHTLHDDSGRSHGPFAAVVCTAPAEQTTELLAIHPVARALAASVRMRPCFALGLVLDAMDRDSDFDAIFTDGAVLSWIARDGSKPGRGDSCSWMVHAAPEWSEQQLDMDMADVQQQLTHAFFEQAGLPPRSPRVSSVHRWRYAQAAEPLELDYWLDEATGLAIAGDWLAGNRVEGAWLSGTKLAQRLLATEL